MRFPDADTSLFVAHSFLRLTALASVLAATLGETKVARAQAPIELQVAIEEANEALFDGEYDEAIRLTTAGLKWTSNTANRRLLASINRDWTVEECMLNALQAEALLLSGNVKKATSQLDRAVAQLEARRTYYHRNFGKADWFWLYTAFLHFVEGDLARPMTDFGTVGQDDAPRVQAFAKTAGGSNKAARCYRKAGDCLERLLQLDPTPTTEVASGLPLIVNRLMTRLLVSLARVQITKFGNPTIHDATDAESYLIRAEELLRNNVWWKLFIAPDALFQLSYARLQDIEDEKKKAQGTQATATMTEQELIQIKQFFCHAISDYVMVMIHRAEVAAFQELQGVIVARDKAWATSNAERCYQRALQLLRNQHRLSHPMLHEVELSKARWYATLSDPEAVANLNLEGKELRRRVSFVRDCLFLVHKIRAHRGAAMPLQHRLELQFIELRALENMLAMNDGRDFLSDAQLQEVTDRMTQVRTGLEDLIDERDAKK
jgi:tetratricopeptide (TPR) repeat protein